MPRFEAPCDCSILRQDGAWLPAGLSWRCAAEIWRLEKDGCKWARRGWRRDRGQKDVRPESRRQPKAEVLLQALRGELRVLRSRRDTIDFCDKSRRKGDSLVRSGEEVQEGLKVLLCRRRGGSKRQVRHLCSDGTELSSLDDCQASCWSVMLMLSVNSTGSGSTRGVPMLTFLLFFNSVCKM